MKWAEMLIDVFLTPALDSPLDWTEEEIHATSKSWGCKHTSRDVQETKFLKKMNISPDLLPVFPQVTSHHAVPTFCSRHRLLTDLTRLRASRETGSKFQHGGRTFFTLTKITQVFLLSIARKNDNCWGLGMGEEKPDFSSHKCRVFAFRLASFRWD